MMDTCRSRDAPPSNPSLSPRSPARDFSPETRPIPRAERLRNPILKTPNIDRIGTEGMRLECGTNPVVVGTLAVLGDTFVKQNKLPLETLVSLPNEIWKPAECPLCARGVELR
jgi:hypothetical protein